MTPCPEPQSLKALLDGELPEVEQLILQTHLDKCSTCQLAMERLVARQESWSNIAEQLAAKTAQSADALHQVIHRLKVQHASGPNDATQSHAGGQPAASEDLSFLRRSEIPGNLGRLGHYEILSLVGKGAFGLVFKARDTILDRIVAIKVLAPQLSTNATARRRFIREARTAAAVSHDHVVGIHWIDEINNPPYIVMQFILGISLQERIDRTGPLELNEILRIGMQTASGLAAAHAQGHVHRDIKPSNILLENGIEKVKITDFGLARAVDDASVTQSGVIAGTPMFMSPEQARGEAVDHRSDLFSLGSVLYMMCTGRVPFRASGTHAVLRRVIEESPRSIREINPEIPQWLCDIIAKLQAKNPEDRFQSAKEVADLLGQHLAHLQQPAHTPMPPPITLHAEVADKKIETIDWEKRFLSLEPHQRRMLLGGLHLAYLFTLIALWFPWSWETAYQMENTDSREPAWVTRFQLGVLEPVELTFEVLNDGFWFRISDVRFFTLFLTVVCSISIVSLARQTYRFSRRVQAALPSTTAAGPRKQDEPTPSSTASMWKTGDRVLVPWERQWLYPATIGKVESKLVHVCFDDGYTRWVRTEDIRPLEIGEGSRVFGNWESGWFYYPGVVTKRDGERIQITYDDGEQEWTNLGTIRLPSGQPPRRGKWLLAAAVVLVLLTLFDVWYGYTFFGRYVTNRGAVAIGGMFDPDLEQVVITTEGKKDLSSWTLTPRNRRVLLPSGKYRVHVVGRQGYTATKMEAFRESNYIFLGAKVSPRFQRTEEQSSMPLELEAGEYISLTFAMEKTKTDAPKAFADHKRFQGRWRVISGEANGRPMDKADLPKWIEFKDNRYRLQPRNGTLVERMFIIQPGRASKTIDLFELETKQHSSNHTNSITALASGIYKFDDSDTLIMNLGSPMDPPTAFETDRNNRSQMLVCKRDEDEWTKLFNGKDLAGWTTKNPNRWKIEDGVLVGRTSSQDPIEYLVNDLDGVDNFHLRLEAKVDSNTAGSVILRATQQNSIWQGCSVALAGQETGAGSFIFRYRGEPPLATGKIADSPKVGTIISTGMAVIPTKTKPLDNEWFTMDIIAIGPHITVTINGQTAVDKNGIDPEFNSARGRIVLALNSGKVMFRKIAIKKLPSTEPEKHVATDEDKLQGTWRSIAPGPLNVDVKFEGKQFVMQSSPKNDAQADLANQFHLNGDFGVDASAQPRRISIYNPKDRFQQLLGIYRLEGGTLHLCVCIDPKNDTFPTEFATNLQTKTTLFVLKRVQAQTKTVDNDRHHLEGRWLLVGVESKGNQIAVEKAEIPFPSEMRIAGKQYEIVWNGNQDKGVLTIDSMKKPAEIDLAGSKFTGSSTRKGIYELDGDHLKLCLPFGNPLADLPRPTTFQTGTESKNIVLTYLRDATQTAGDGFVSIFNGKDLTGWSSAKSGVGQWKVVDGAITCEGAQDHLITDRGDFGDFHLRAEVKINAQGNSGIYFRARRPLKIAGDYEAQITNVFGQKYNTGSLHGLVQVNEMLVPPDTWFTYEIIAKGNRIQLLVSGRHTAYYVEPQSDRPAKGHIALQHHDPQTEVYFRKIEIKELKPDNVTLGKELVDELMQLIELKKDSIVRGKELLDLGRITNFEYLEMEAELIEVQIEVAEAFAENAEKLRLLEALVKKRQEQRNFVEQRFQAQIAPQSELDTAEHRLREARVRWLEAGGKK